MRIFVNYIYNKKDDTYRLLDTTGPATPDQKWAIYDTEEDIGEPLVLNVTNEKGQTWPVVYDRVRYEAENQKFRLALDDNGKVIEDPNGREFWFRKGTDISKLVYKDGRLQFETEEAADKATDEADPKPAPKAKKPAAKK